MPSDTKPLDWKQAETQLEKVTKFLSSFEGKHGHNPFMFYDQKIKPLADRYLKGERSQELFDQMIKLKEEPPTIDKLDIPSIGQIVVVKPTVK